ncbi:MAG: hypothetical protein VW270_00420 [Candidatus Poseidoniales archaeon]
MADKLNLNRSYFFLVNTIAGYEDYMATKGKEKLEYVYTFRMDGSNKDHKMHFKMYDDHRKYFQVFVPKEIVSKLNEDRESSERILTTIQDSMNNFCNVENIDLGKDDVRSVRVNLKHDDNEKRKKLFEIFYDQIKVPGGFKKEKIDWRYAQEVQIIFTKKSRWD